MQFTPWDNPMGTDEFEFIECAAPSTSSRSHRIPGAA